MINSYKEGIVNYQGIKYESIGVDLNNFDKDRIIKRFANTTVTGINVLILIYKAPIKKVTYGGIILPDISLETDKEYSSMVGMVLQLGIDAYKGSQFPNGPYCKVGDWVEFPRGASMQSKYEDEPIIIVEDFKVKLVVDDPSKVSR
jgi:co-chaperonin GroES (HSP10)